MHEARPPPASPSQRNHLKRPRLNLCVTRLDDRIIPAAIPGLYSTGVDDAGQPLAPGVGDGHYAIVAAPISLSGTASVTQSGFPFPYWAADSGTSGWLSPRADETGPSSDPAGTYTYETTFDLTGLDPASAAITGSLFADNHVEGVLLNGVPVDGFTPNGNGSDYAAGVPLSVTSGFQDGRNTLDFLVLNDAGDAYNPTGFRADFSGSADPAVDQNATAFPVYSTGVADDGSPLSPGQPDPHYTITAAPGGGTTGPAAVTLAGYPFTGVSPSWVADSGTSQWVSPDANQDSRPGDGGVSEPAGAWTYSTTFDLSGFDPTTARITGRVTADNTLSQVLLNGVDVSYQSSGGTKDFGGLRQLVISSGFQDGANTLTFVVNNADDTPSGTGNACGLRADLTGTAVPTDFYGPTGAAVEAGLGFGDTVDDSGDEVAGTVDLTEAPTVVSNGGGTDGGATPAAARAAAPAPAPAPAPADKKIILTPDVVNRFTLTANYLVSPDPTPQYDAYSSVFVRYTFDLSYKVISHEGYTSMTVACYASNIKAVAVFDTNFSYRKSGAENLPYADKLLQHEKVHLLTAVQTATHMVPFLTNKGYGAQPVVGAIGSGRDHNTMSSPGVENHDSAAWNAYYDLIKILSSYAGEAQQALQYVNKTYDDQTKGGFFGGNQEVWNTRTDSQTDKYLSEAGYIWS